MTYIDARPWGTTPSGKTKRWKRWRLYAKDGDALLGIIQWRSGWRCYVFEPAFPTIYEQVCLREIAAFIEGKTKEQKAKP